MAESLIICMNHDSDNDNEQESQRSPRRPFLIHIVAVFMKYIQMTVRLVNFISSK